MTIRRRNAVATTTVLVAALVVGSCDFDLTGAREKHLTAFVSGYSYWDNTPPASAAIARPVVHREAGGTGTYFDPITIAVGHRIENGEQTLDFPEGTRFYIAALRKYAIVEDLCGDGDTPQDGPCHVGWDGHPWLDLYVGGAAVSADAADACMEQITGLQRIVIHPAPYYPVYRGEVMASGCRVF